MEIGGTLTCAKTMPVIPIDSLDDPRVALYRNLKDRELERRGHHFIAEGAMSQGDYRLVLQRCQVFPELMTRFRHAGNRIQR